MNRSQLREVIKSIVARKLKENTDSSDRGNQLASSLKKMLANGEGINKITIQTHHGDVPLEIVEWWPVNDELRIGVIADGSSKLREIAPAVTSTGAQVNPSVNQQDDSTDQMTDSERNQIANAQKEQEKLTNDVRRIEGGIQKLREPVERKIQALEKAKANKERKLGTIASKITNIQRKYSKV